MTRFRRCLPVLLAALPACLSAQEAAEDRANLGLRVHLQAPMGNLRDLNGGQNGISLAGFVDLPLEELRGISLRPLVQFDYFPKGDDLHISGNSTRIFAYMLGLEMVWRPNDDLKGPYLMAALGAQNWRITTQSSGGDTRIGGTKLGANGGVGLRWNSHLALEVKAFWSPVDAGVRATGVSAGFTWMF
ncbi:MAG TPA: outer membrane beta-barrel protein [Holophagaceae bacterium]|nr:outer membrane beta-barrel protein [Holophagaceae bacterium]